MQSFASDHRYAQTNHVLRHVYGPLRKTRAQGPMYYSDFFCACRWSLANDCTDLWLWKVPQSGKLQIGALRDRPQRFPIILTNSALESHGQGLSNAPRVGGIGLR